MAERPILRIGLAAARNAATVEERLELRGECGHPRHAGRVGEAGEVDPHCHRGEGSGYSESAQNPGLPS